jgi:geranylgeranyl reductase family protein
MDYDAIVVGAGPAGASAAFWLGKAGRQVLVLEKERLPRYKPCGGAVPRAVLEHFPFDFSPVVEQWIDRVRFRFYNGAEVAADVPERSVAMVMRDHFDWHILRHAKVDVQDSSPVIALQQDKAGVEATTRSGETFRARYLIGADGANSRVARLVGLRRGKRMGIAIEVEVPADDDRLAEYANTALFILGAPPQGYLWVFPKAGHLSVGIGAMPGQTLTTIRESLHRETAQLGIQVDGTQQRAHPLPFHLRRESLHRGRVLLVGDAAGLIDPLFGEGIRHAVDSGCLAARCILADDLHNYTCRIHREIGDDLLWGLFWARWFYKHPWGGFTLGIRNPWFVNEFLRLLNKQTTYRQMTIRALLNFSWGPGLRMLMDYNKNKIINAGGKYVKSRLS